MPTSTPSLNLSHIFTGKLSFGTILPSAFWVWMLFLLVVVVYAVLSSIFLFHWRSYAYNRTKITFVTRLYFFVSGILLLMMFTSLIFYS